MKRCEKEMCESREDLLQKAEIYRELSEYYSGVLRSGKAAAKHIGALLPGQIVVPKIDVDSAYDYNQLFIGPCTLLAPPFEAFYHKMNPKMLESENLLVRSACVEAGLTSDAEDESFDGHVFYSFAFLSKLLETLANLPSLNSKEADGLWQTYQWFLKEHILAWIFDHLRDVYRASVSSFCKDVASAVKRFLLSEQALVTLEACEA